MYLLYSTLGPEVGGDIALIINTNLKKNGYVTHILIYIIEILMKHCYLLMIFNTYYA